MEKSSTDYGWNRENNNSPDYLISSINKILPAYVNHKKELIMDAGCGGGQLLNLLYEKNFSNIRGFDISQ